MVVGAAAASERQSVMRLGKLAIVGLRRVWRVVAITALAGVIPLLVTGCFRSFYVIDHIDMKRQTSVAAWQVRLGSGHGNLFLYWTHNAFTPGGYVPKDYFGSSPDFLVWQDHGPFDARDGIHLIQWRTGNGSMPGYRSLDFQIGYPTLILIAGVLVGWRMRRGRRIRREALAARGLCTSCGYDLRASPARCPECGKPAVVRPAA